MSSDERLDFPGLLKSSGSRGYCFLLSAISFLIAGLTCCGSHLPPSYTYGVVIRRFVLLILSDVVSHVFCRGCLVDALPSHTGPTYSKALCAVLLSFAVDSRARQSFSTELIT